MLQVLALLGLLMFCLQAGPALAHEGDPGDWLLIQNTGGSWNATSSTAGTWTYSTPVNYTVPAGKHLKVIQGYSKKSQETFFYGGTYSAPAEGFAYINSYRVTWSLNSPSALDWHFKSGAVVTFSGSGNTQGVWSCWLMDATACTCAPAASPTPAPSVSPSPTSSPTPVPSSEPSASPAPGGGSSDLFIGVSAQQATDLLLVVDKLVLLVLYFVGFLAIMRVFRLFVRLV